MHRLGSLLCVALVLLVVFNWQALAQTETCGEASKMQKQKAAVVLGASGGVGQKLMKELIENPQFSTVVTIVRTAGKVPTNSKVVEHVVSDMSKLDQEVETAITSRLGGQECVGFSTLGVGAGTGFMTIAQHRAVDVDLNSKFAEGLKKSGKVDHFVFMSAAGANPTAWSFGWGGAGMPRYNRVKGEAEEAVKNAGIKHVSIFRPALILGNAHSGKFAETVIPLFSFLTPASLLSIKIEDLGKSMGLRGAQDISTETRTFSLYNYPEMMELINASH